LSPDLEGLAQMRDELMDRAQELRLEAENLQNKLEMTIARSRQLLRESNERLVSSPAFAPASRLEDRRQEQIIQRPQVGPASSLYS
jgi:hypothetical protein